MKRLNLGRISLITTLFVFAHLAILLISNYVLYNYDALSVDAVETMNALKVLILYASVMLWVQCIGITLVLCKKGCNAKTVEICGFIQLFIWIAVAVLFAVIHGFFLRYYSVSPNTETESIMNSASGIIYIAIFIVNYLICIASSKLITASYQLS